MTARAAALLARLARPEPRRRPSGWALALDAAIAVGAAAVAILQEPWHFGPDSGPKLGNLLGPALTNHVGTATVIAAAFTALPLAARRLCPITVWLVIAAAVLGLRHGHVPSIAFATAVFAAYSAVVHSRYRNLAICSVLVVTLAATATFADTLPRFPSRFTALFAIVPVVAAGLGIRELRRRLYEAATRLGRATEEREAATRQAINAERTRIAGELHDVVTHNVSVMVVQAGAARSVLASSPAEAEAALLAVEAGGRAAMTELRNLLELLSPADDQIAWRPQPGLGELDTLIRRVQAAGVPVELHVTGTPRPLAPGADLAAYRVVQEALTNVLRHAGQAATSVILRWGDQLVITIDDDGTVADGVPGRGLLGLRERLCLYGGQLDAGPRPGGGWQVRAALPTGPTP
ncbi:MAG: sensor histidine kinase [Jatrophihabitantaceae bacterium]